MTGRSPILGTNGDASSEGRGALAIKNALVAADDLPTLPLVALEVARLAGNPLASSAEMVRLIRNDPSLTARILRVANSPYYGMPRRIDSLSTALVVLGMREIGNLVTSISVVKTFPERSGHGLNMPAFWNHSAGSAEVARIISSRLHLRLHGAEFTAALLHDVGKLVLDQYFHDDYARALDAAYAEQLSQCEAEQRVLGVDHAEIGAWLAETWSLPPAIAEAIRHHHKPQLASINPVLAGVVHLADTISQAILDDARRDHLNHLIETDPIWDVLSTKNPEIQWLDIGGFICELEDNIQRAREFTRYAGM